MTDVSVIWFRRDLRLYDNESVAKACAKSKNCIFVFALDPWFFSQPEIGWLRVKFLFESLIALDTALQKHNNRLVILKGESVASLTGLLKTLRDNKYHPTLYFNHDIQVEYGRKRDEAITAYCTETNTPLTVSHNYFLLHDESQMDTWWPKYYEYQYDEQYDTPTINELKPSLEKILKTLPQINPQSIASELGISIPIPRQALFNGGEVAASHAVYSFLKDRVDGYRWKISRPYLAQLGATSLLGPHLAFGTISSRAVFQASVNYRAKLKERLPKKAFDIATYLDRLRWRDSFTQRLWFHPELSWKNRFPEFDSIYTEEPLDDQKQEYFERWQQGKTGFPLLDAAMIQLKEDGFINFRMRAMSATFLAINCGVSWHHGARHFMNCLVDGDIAINHWQWQMQSGITNPLSPTFRIYSPTKNLRDRDNTAAYVHFWLPETRGKNVEAIIKDAKPMLDFSESRKRNGKIVSDLRKQVRERIIAEKGLELEGAKVAQKTVLNYGKYSAGRYKRYIKDPHTARNS